MVYALYVIHYGVCFVCGTMVSACSIQLCTAVLQLEIVGRHTQNFRRVATVKVGFRIGSTTLYGAGQLELLGIPREAARARLSSSELETR